ncbi:MAG: glycogen/starch/alpha-glucan phosphorylase [Proteocatella sp.]|nr:glycogen/starch/alpha-glucan phosphorylase [Proteocatella sp.]
MDIEKIVKAAQKKARTSHGKDLSEANAWQLHDALSSSVMEAIGQSWMKHSGEKDRGRKAAYLSAEFLVGRAVQNNLLNLGISEKLQNELSKKGTDLNILEDVEDAALGNGGLGRLAACFMESGATMGLPLDGYGIRYRYGLFRQKLEDGFQKEEADDWAKHGDPWSVRRDEDTVRVDFADYSVLAVPYDMPIIGYGGKNISTLRLWQSEPLTEFDFAKFNDQQYDLAVQAKNRAEDISRVLYPNDDALEGKKLRFRQQYFFSSAALADMVRIFKREHGSDLSKFADYNAVQLNDTHPVIAIPELIRILTDEEGMGFAQALEISKKTFAYTNHTIMPEALEKWDARLIKSLVPRVYEIIEMIHAAFEQEKLELIRQDKISKALAHRTKIIRNRTVHMAHLAIYGGSYVNGVAAIHTEIIKHDTLRDWYQLYPEKFQNKTNGITQRRWLALCNRELSDMISRKLTNRDWITDLTQLKALEVFSDDEKVIEQFSQIKDLKKQQLAQYIMHRENIEIDPASIFDIQIKRLHEYKRQLLNILTILYIYREIKSGNLKDFHKTTFIFGGKSAPGYRRAKSIIKLINEVAALIDSDEVVRDIIKVVFISNYNVSYAEKLVAAADVSEQISTAGTEASGTGNMKFMLNGAVTLGTLDGANVEIVQEAGLENNFIFGATVEEIKKISKTYDPNEIYASNPKIKAVLDMLIDGSLSDGGTGGFKELHDSILKGASWHRPDQYFILHDFMAAVEGKIRVNEAYRDIKSFRKKCYINMCNAGKFSSDRTIMDYAQNIWKIEKIRM